MTKRAIVKASVFLDVIKHLLMPVLLIGSIDPAVAGRAYHLTLYNKIMSSAANQQDRPIRKMGDTIVAHMNVYGSTDLTREPVATAELSFVVTVPATVDNPVETRLFHGVFTFSQDDSLVIDGISLANIANDWMNHETSSRSIVGGTGKYRGARGVAYFRRKEENLFEMDLRFRRN